MNAKEIEREITESEYEDVLDDIYGDITICGMKYPSGRALKELDPVAFRCGKVDYEDSLDHQWECGECGIVYDDEDDADKCCKPEYGEGTENDVQR